MLVTDGRPPIAIDSVAVEADSAAATRRALGTLHRSGYFRARVDSLNPVRRVVFATAGPAMAVERVEFLEGGRDSLTAEDRGMRRTFADSMVGRTYSEYRFRMHIARLLEALERRGFHRASVGIRGIALLDSNRSIGLTVEVSPGRRPSIQGILLHGARRTRLRTIERILAVRTGTQLERFDARAMQAALEESGLFTRVDLPVLLATGDSTAILQVVVRESAPGAFDAALGYQPHANGSGGGLVGSGQLELLSPFGEGRRFALLFDRLPGRVSRAEASVHDPAFLGSSIGLEAEFRGLQQDSTFGRQVFGAVALVDLGGALVLTATVSKESVRPGVAGAQLVGPRQWVSRSVGTFGGIGIRFGGRESRLNPSTGLQLQLRLDRGSLSRESFVREGAVGSTPSTDVPVLVSTRARMERLSGWARAYVPVGRGVLVLGADGSLLVADEFDRSDLLRLGGARTLRGYDEDRFFGRAVGRGLVEARYRLDSLSYAYLFADAGFVDVPPVSGLVEGFGWHPGFGFGAQIETGAGLVLATYGFNPEDGPTRGRIHVAFSFGL